MALEHGGLRAIFIGTSEDQPAARVRFEDGPRLKDETFRAVVDAIRECKFFSDKLAIIAREIRSMSELIDLLGASCLFGDEFSRLFGRLSDAELALLLRRLPIEIVDEHSHVSESEREWHEAFRRYLEEMDADRRERLADLAEQLL